MRNLRGYFGIGVESLSKPMNLGALQRTAHAFGAAFTFTVSPAPKIRVLHHADTAKSDLHVPWYLWNSIEEMQLPKGCVLDIVWEPTEMASFAQEKPLAPTV